MLELEPLQQLLKESLQAACLQVSGMLALDYRLALPISHVPWSDHSRARIDVAQISAWIPLSGIGTGAMVIGCSQPCWEHLQHCFAKGLKQHRLSMEALQSAFGELLNVVACTSAETMGQRIDGLVRPDVPNVLHEPVHQVLGKQQKKLEVPTIVYGTMYDEHCREHWIDVYWLLDAAAATAVIMRLARFRNV